METSKDGETVTFTKSNRRPALSRVQEEVLTMIVVGQWLARAGLGVPPSWREMLEWGGWKSPQNIRAALQALEKKGYIRRSREGVKPGQGLNRAIEVLP